MPKKIYAIYSNNPQVDHPRLPRGFILREAARLGLASGVSGGKDIVANPRGMDLTPGQKSGLEELGVAYFPLQEVSAERRN